MHVNKQRDAKSFTLRTCTVRGNESSYEIKGKVWEDKISEVLEIEKWHVSLFHALNQAAVAASLPRPLCVAVCIDLMLYQQYHTSLKLTTLSFSGP